MTNGIKYSHNETPIHKDPSTGHSDDPSVYTPTLVDWLHELLDTVGRHSRHGAHSQGLSTRFEQVMGHSGFEKKF